MSPKPFALALIAAAAIGVSPAAAKPMAPVTLTASVQLTGDGWQVVVDAAPTRDVSGLEVEVAGRVTRFGTTVAKRARHLVVPVSDPDGTGTDVVVIARVGGRIAARTVRVGRPAPVIAPPVATIRVVNGVTVAEVRE